MGSVHSIFVKELLKRTGGRLYYHEDSSMFNATGWLKDDGAEAMGWGLARLPIAEPGLHISLQKYQSQRDAEHKSYNMFPLKNSNAVTEDGKIYTRYEFVKTVKVGAVKKDFPKSSRAKSILNNFIKSIGSGITYTEGKESCLVEGGVQMAPAKSYKSSKHYWYDFIYYTVLAKEGWLEYVSEHKDKATKFHIKRVMADMTACLALHAVGWAPPVSSTRYVQQLRNAFIANPKLLTFAGYNCEKYLRELAV